VSLLLPTFVGASRDEVRRTVEPAIRYYARELSSLLEANAHNWTTDAERARMQKLLAQVRGTTFETMNDSMTLFATPGVCVERIHQLREEFQAGRVIAWMNLVGAIPHARTPGHATTVALGRTTRVGGQR
jgi:alkanesulfonate monooxygenase SsuD/methylene tetrahydromethanopterin reductase-like flavin-dependent oxidoreductase (luciferase family)